MSELLLETQNLTKSYGNLKALNDFSVKFEENKIYGLLGRNGAGKTTLLNLITSRIFADSGRITAFGENVVENAHVLPHICYMPEKNMFMKKMRVKNTLKFAAEFFENFDTAYADSLCQKFELDKGKRYDQLSRGYESILRIVIGLAARAPLTIFDEPVLGLDAAVRDVFYRELLDDYGTHPRTFIISTHLIEESADIFEEAVIIKSGHLISQSTVEKLKDSAHYISGKSDLVDNAVAGLHVIHSESVANVKICTVYQHLDEAELSRFHTCGLDVSPVPVQKLFIYLTNQDQGVHSI
jgi:ABC-2 type transport system ATP-binding protein